MPRVTAVLLALVSACLLDACAGRDGPIASGDDRADRAQRPRPVALRFTLDAGQRLIYRRDDPGDDRAAANETHWVERRPDGSLVLGVEDPAWVDAGNAEMPADLVFPLPERAVGPETSWAHRTVALGEMRLAVDEEFRLATASGREVTVAFRRRTGVIGDDPGAPEPMTEQRGRAIFDTAAGRYRRIEFQETRSEAFGGGSGSAVWVLDEQRLPSASAAATRHGDLDAWVAAHDAAAEITAVVEALADPAAQPAALGLQLEAHAVELWTAVLDRPDAGPRFVADPRVIQAVQRGLPDEVLELLRARWADAPFVQALVAQTADERLRPQLRELAAGRGPAATDARLTLQALDLTAAPRIERWQPFARLPARLQAVWARLQVRDGLDPSPLVPVFLALASARAPAAVGELCGQVVRAAGLFDAADDRRMWRQWWSAEGATPWADRLVAGARAAPPERRADAVASLARGPANDEARALLADWLAEPAVATRLSAAAALARWRDRRAVPVLVGLLEDPSVAGAALDALGGFADTTLGFDPSAPTPAALTRWQQWRDRQPTGR